jgi:hypothetical protein
MARRTFQIQRITVNGRPISRVVVDDHATENHPDITDDTILDLVRLLDGIEQSPDDKKQPFEYFATLLPLQEKQYRLVWLLEDEQLYVGVLTAYRDDRSQ